MPDDRAALLEVAGLTITLASPAGPVPLVSDVSFSIAAGEKFGLVGESGSGKTMLALALMRLLPPGITATGTVRFAGLDLLALPEAEMHRLRGGQIGMIFQEPVAALNPVFTLEAQITVAVRAHAPMSQRRARDRATELLAMVGIPDAGRRLGFYPHQLSGGLCQRAMIAMALAGGARLLIADEPTTSLDVTIQQEIVELIDRLARETSVAVLFISHDLGVVARLCDRIAVAYAGELQEVGSAATLLRAPAHPYTAALVRCVPDLHEIGVLQRGIAGTPPLPGTWPAGCRFAARCPLAAEACKHPQSLAPLDGRLVRCWRAGQATALAPGEAGRAVAQSDATPLIEVRDLSVTYRLGFGRIVSAVAGLSFDVVRGRTLALIGESGSGKSTVARAICGFVQPDAGTIALDGTAIDGPARAGELGVQVVSQDPGAALDPRWPLWRSVVEPRLARFPRDRDGGRARAADLLERVGLNRSMVDRRPHQLSGGQRQRVTIARALASDPAIIILDEPVSALDVSVRNEILALLGELQRESGLTYLLISHDIGAVLQIAADVAVLYRGRLAEIGRAAEVLTRPLHPYTRMLIRAVPTIDTVAVPASAPQDDMGASASGCPFQPRCAHGTDACHETLPALRLVHRTRVACHRAEELAA